MTENPKINSFEFTVKRNGLLVRSVLETFKENADKFLKEKQRDRIKNQGKDKEAGDEDLKERVGKNKGSKNYYTVGENNNGEVVFKRRLVETTIKGFFGEYKDDVDIKVFKRINQSSIKKTTERIRSLDSITSHKEADAAEEVNAPETELNTQSQDNTYIQDKEAQQANLTHTSQPDVSNFTGYAPSDQLEASTENTIPSYHSRSSEVKHHPESYSCTNSFIQHGSTHDSPNVRQCYNGIEMKPYLDTTQINFSNHSSCSEFKQHLGNYSFTNLPIEDQGSTHDSSNIRQYNEDKVKPYVSSNAIQGMSSKVDELLTSFTAVRAELKVLQVNVAELMELKTPITELDKEKVKATTDFEAEKLALIEENKKLRIELKSYQISQKTLSKYQHRLEISSKRNDNIIQNLWENQMLERFPNVWQLHLGPKEEIRSELLYSLRQLGRCFILNTIPQQILESSRMLKLGIDLPCVLNNLKIMSHSKNLSECKPESPVYMDCLLSLLLLLRTLSSGDRDWSFNNNQSHSNFIILEDVLLPDQLNEALTHFIREGKSINRRHLCKNVPEYPHALGSPHFPYPKYLESRSNTQSLRINGNILVFPTYINGIWCVFGVCSIINKDNRQKGLRWLLSHSSPEVWQYFDSIMKDCGVKDCYQVPFFYYNHNYDQIDQALQLHQRLRFTGLMRELFTLTFEEWENMFLEQKSIISLQDTYSHQDLYFEYPLILNLLHNTQQDWCNFQNVPAQYIDETTEDDTISMTLGRRSGSSPDNYRYSFQNLNETDQNIEETTKDDTTSTTYGRKRASSPENDNHLVRNIKHQKVSKALRLPTRKVVLDQSEVQIEYIEEDHTIIEDQLVKLDQLTRPDKYRYTNFTPRTISSNELRTYLKQKREKDYMDKDYLRISGMVTAKIFYFCEVCDTKFEIEKGVKFDLKNNVKCGSEACGLSSEISYMNSISCGETSVTLIFSGNLAKFIEINQGRRFTLDVRPEKDSVSVECFRVISIYESSSKIDLKSNVSNSQEVDLRKDNLSVNEALIQDSNETLSTIMALKLDDLKNIGKISDENGNFNAVGVIMKITPKFKPTSKKDFLLLLHIQDGTYKGHDVQVNLWGPRAQDTYSENSIIIVSDCKIKLFDRTWQLTPTPQSVIHTVCKSISYNDNIQHVINWQNSLAKK
jgi:hypothetical protein